MSQEIEGIEDIFRQMQESEEEILELQMKIQGVENKILSLASNAIHLSKPHHTQWVIRVLYWHFQVSVLFLEEQTGLARHKIRAIAGGITVGVPCCHCGKQTSAYVKSKSELKTRKDFSCPQCAAAIEQQRMERDAQHKKKKDREKERLEELRRMPYQDYLRTPEWLETREWKLKRAGFRCQACNVNGHLQVHHRTYENRGNERDSDLIVLCSDCHSIFHQQGKLRGD